MTKPDQAVWLDVLSQLRKKYPHVCRQWFEELEPIGMLGGVFRVRIDQEVRQRYLQRECAQAFTDALQAVTGALISVRFVGPDDDLASANGSTPQRHHGLHTTQNAPHSSSHNGSPLSPVDPQAPASSSTSPIAVPARGGLRKCLSALIFLGCGGKI